MKLKRLTFAVVMFVIITVVFAFGGGQRIALWNPDSPLIVIATDTCIDTVYATVASGLGATRGFRVNGANFPKWGMAVADDNDSLWFDTAVTMVRSHPSGFVVTTKTRSATVCRITVTGGHFDSLLGTIMAATDSMTIDFDSTGKTTRHIVGTCDSAISATVVALKIANAIVVGNADSFFVGWTAVPKAYHATFRSDVDSFCTHTLDADTTWGNRSFDSLWMNDARATNQAITGWTVHGWKRGGNVTDTVWNGEATYVEPSLWYQWHPKVWRIYRNGTYARDSIYVSIALQTRWSAHDYAGWVTLGTFTSADSTLDTALYFNMPRLSDADTAKAKFGHIGDYFQTLVTVTDSNSLPAHYGTVTQLNILSDLIKIQ